jgi:hypothetical protein
LKLTMKIALSILWPSWPQSKTTFWPQLKEKDDMDGLNYCIRYHYSLYLIIFKSWIHSPKTQPNCKRRPSNKKNWCNFWNPTPKSWKNIKKNWTKCSRNRINQHPFIHQWHRHNIRLKLKTKPYNNSLTNKEDSSFSPKKALF